MSIRIFSSTAFARPADTTAYTIADLVANSATAGSVVPGNVNAHDTPGGRGVIRRVHLLKSGIVLTLAQFRVHFYKTLPVPVNGDNAAWLTSHAGYLGGANVTIDKAFQSGASIGSIGLGIPIIGTGINYDLATGAQRIYFLLEALAAYVPVASEQFSVTIETDIEV